MRTALLKFALLNISHIFCSSGQCCEESQSRVRSASVSGLRVRREERSQKKNDFIQYTLLLGRLLFAGRSRVCCPAVRCPPPRAGAVYRHIHSYSILYYVVYSRSE